MSKKIIDPVFGEMTYQHSWVRSEGIDWWGTYTVEITAHAYTGQLIAEEQKVAYLDYKNTAEKFIADSVPLLVKFINDSYDLASSISNADLLALLKPTAVLFQRDGSWGVLFESDLEPENGIAIFKENGVIKVGTQDDFL